MKRREFNTLIGGAVIASPLAVRAQQAAGIIVLKYHSGPNGVAVSGLLGFIKY
jgi:hypothetical protein